jgi:hypothetical protein
MVRSSVRFLCELDGLTKARNGPKAELALSVCLAVCMRQMSTDAQLSKQVLSETIREPNDQQRSAPAGVRRSARNPGVAASACCLDRRGAARQHRARGRQRIRHVAALSRDIELRVTGVRRHRARIDASFDKQRANTCARELRTKHAAALAAPERNPRRDARARTPVSPDCR